MKMRRTSAALFILIFSFSLLLLNPGEVHGFSIKLVEKVEFADNSTLQIVPRSFCVTDGGDGAVYLIPDYHTGHVKVFEQNGKYLRFLKKFGPNGSDNTEFENPNYCFYDALNSKFGIIDVGVGPIETRKVYIFDCRSKTDFEQVGKVPNAGGFDIRLGGDGKHLIISGYVTANEKSYELYSINPEYPKQIEYLLSSHEKYGLANDQEYRRKYFEERELPAIGIDAFMDVEGDAIYYVWTGKLSVTKIEINLNTNTKEKTVFGHKTVHYTEPSAVSPELLKARREKDFTKYNNIRARMSFIRDIFATPRHVFVVYEGPNQGNYRLQGYTPEGTFLDDIVIPGNWNNDSYQNMWFEKRGYRLYSLVTTKSNKKAPQILIYQVVE